MNISEIKELLNQFDESSLTEFDLREGSFELYMNKNQSARQQIAQPAAQPVQSQELAPSPTSEVAQQVSQPVAKNESVETAQTTAAVGEEVLSPIVGVVYLQPSPDKPAFKSVGETVKKGEVLCIIEAMKLMNEITSEFDGEITEILVENEDVVEFHQPLFRIKTK
ncbi:acetyl-CoA carboxylase, biotin carboxyl carrier protein [Enterococcus sp. JM4C]|uniref:acetyl-CoA carboxylase biotin carboxyl carrier protein n=1 Tax=Candidatus Enterococcus huntleyi TaxID=1857217 RepID=UPI00137992B6|nr:acetyl-CoA carboxylase biotin carboxyl carrier protein [Enterococcus sp. JM4C]KAF1296827.1 acetyl-CoA carboxylase, biotin carboxyl carrier protein [Enterococcus sp. JM4C]